MNKYKSTKPPTIMYRVESPFTVDKSASWGEGNIQNMAAYSFMQLNSEGILTHAVAEDSNTGLPVGWRATDRPHVYTKKPVYAVYMQPADKKLQHHTSDGDMTYDLVDGLYLVYNSRYFEGVLIPDATDTWCMKPDAFESLFVLYN